MGTYFDINGSAMIYIPQSAELKNAKFTEEANNLIQKECQIIIKKFKNKLQELVKQNPEVFDNISFEGFYPLGLDINCFQNKAHGPSTDLINFENGKRIHVHHTTTLTINGTIETDNYEKHKQLFIDAIKELHEEYAVFRLNLITMWEGQQDAIIYSGDQLYDITTVPLTNHQSWQNLILWYNKINQYNINFNASECNLEALILPIERKFYGIKTSWRRDLLPSQ